MATITLSHITPQHFFEAVKLLKTTEYRIYLTIDSLEVRFPSWQLESKEQVDKRFSQMEHLKLFLEELVNSDIPIDLDEFIRTYRRTPGRRFFRNR